MTRENESIKLWCLKAENDLKNASHEVEHEDPALDTVCFHAQQAAEKYLKVFLLFHDCEIPKTHILIRLIRSCIEIDDTFRELIEQEIDMLTDYAVDLRYADNFYIPSKEEALDAIKKAEFVKRFVLDRL